MIMLINRMLLSQ